MQCAAFASLRDHAQMTQPLAHIPVDAGSAESSWDAVTGDGPLGPSAALRSGFCSKHALYHERHM